MSKPHRMILLMTLITSTLPLSAAVEWETLPPLPDPEGFAGMYAGVSNGALITGGGANFPEKPPWEGGKKIWHDALFLMESLDTGWERREETLPQPMGYGGSVSYRDTIYFLGGNDVEQSFRTIWSLRYEDGRIQIEQTLPPLPKPICYFACDRVGSRIVIAGGITPSDPEGTNAAWYLDLDADPESREWIALPPVPGPPRYNLVGGSHGESFFVFGGMAKRNPDPEDNKRDVLRDAYRYDFSEEGSGEWKSLAKMPRAAGAAPTPALPVRNGSLLITGGVDETLVDFTDVANYPGFPLSTMAYEVRSDKWKNAGDMPAGSTRVVAPTVVWEDQPMIINGEKMPGIRSPEIFAVKNKSGLE